MSLVLIASMLLGFSLTSEPFLSRSSPNSYLLRTNHGRDCDQSDRSPAFVAYLALIAHVFYLVLYAYTQTMIYLTLKNTSST